MQLLRHARERGAALFTSDVFLRVLGAIWRAMWELHDKTQKRRDEHCASGGHSDEL
jgi:hypothetical protein